MIENIASAWLGAARSTDWDGLALSNQWGRPQKVSPSKWTNGNALHRAQLMFEP